MYIYARPKEEVESYIEGAPTGLTGIVGYTIINLETSAPIQARVTGGITELPIGSGSYYTKISAPILPGNYAVVWDTGTISPETSASDVLVVNATGVVPPSVEVGGNLISLETLKLAHGIDPEEKNTIRDLKWELAIRSATAAVRKYADRSFGIPTKSETRTYEYDASGFVDMDDCMEVKKVAFLFGALETPIDAFYWRPEPQEGPPYEYLTIPHWAGIYSPEMGFRYNLDVISKDRGWPGLFPLVKIEALWGWPEVPADVEEATILTASAFADRPGSNVAEAISNYSFTAAQRGNLVELTAIPGRARDLLNAYVRFST